MKISKERYSKYKEIVKEANDALKAAEIVKAEARERGDLSENAEYETACEQVRQYKQIKDRYQNILSSAEIVDVIHDGHFNIGSKISVMLLEDKKPVWEKCRIFTIEEEGNTVFQEILSTESPLGQKILRKTPGIFNLVLGNGRTRTFEVKFADE